MRTIEKKTIKHTLRMTEKESAKLKKQSQRAGISQAEFVRQKVFGLEPAPMPKDTFWDHMAELYEIHDTLTDERVRERIRRLILEIQSEATSPREVMSDGDDEAVAH